MLCKGLAVGPRYEKRLYFCVKRRPRGAERRDFKRRAAIVEETIGLSQSCLEALIKKQVIAQQWLRRLNKQLRMRVRFLTPDGTVVIKLL